MVSVICICRTSSLVEHPPEERGCTQFDPGVRHQLFHVRTLYLLHKYPTHRLSNRNVNISACLAHGLLAQLVERFVYTEDVRGSSPLGPTK